MAEMEKLLKSGGAFGGKQNLSNTFKRIRDEIQHEDESQEDQQEEQSEVNASDVDLDMPLHDNSKLLMDSPVGETSYL